MRGRGRLALGGGIVLALCVVALLAGRLAPARPGALDLAHEWQGPTAAHPLGTGDDGLDVSTEILYGARVSLLVGLLAVALAGSFGTVLGAVAGYAGGAVDLFVMRLVDVLLAFPGLLFAILLVALLGPSLFGLVFSLSATAWVSYARLARGQVLSLRDRDFVLAARGLGASPARIVFRHLVPNLLGPILIQATFGIPGAILAEAALSFLGLGVPPGTPSWGALVDQGASHLLDAPHVALFGGAAIALAVLGFNLLGEELRDRLDSRSRAGPSAP